MKLTKQFNLHKIDKYRYNMVTETLYTVCKYLNKLLIFFLFLIKH